MKVNAMKVRRNAKAVKMAIFGLRADNSLPYCLVWGKYAAVARFLKAARNWGLVEMIRGPKSRRYAQD